MKLLILTVLALAIQAQSVTWTLQSQTTPWLSNGGYEYAMNNYDSQSGQLVVHTLMTFTGTVSVTNGSPTVTWVSGTKFSRVWHESVTGHGNQITINGSTNVSMTGPPTNCTAGVAVSCTTLTMTSNWASASGTYAYYAASGSIYSDTFSVYNSSTNQYTQIIGWGSLDNQCMTDSATYGLPEARQPSMIAIDTKRHRLYMGGGVNNSCTITVSTNGTSTITAASGQIFTQAGLWNGLNATFFNGGTGGSGCTITSVTDSLHATISCATYPNGATNLQVLPPERTYPANKSGVFDWGYLTLNANPANDTWTQLSTSAIATFTSNNVALYENALTYDATSDVMLTFGALYGTNTFVACSVDGNPGGTLTAAQTTAGCGSANTFAQVTGIATTPPGTYWPALVYDSNCGCDWDYGGATTFGNNVSTQTDVWKYVASTKTWTAMNTTSQPAATSITVQPPEMVLNSSAHTLLLHVPDASAGPTSKDYQITPGPSAAWSVSTTSGSSIPACSFSSPGNCGATGVFTGYDPNTGNIVAIMQGNGSNNPANVQVWQGAVPLAPTITSSATLTTGTQNSAYAGWTFTAAGTAPITWGITSGALPTGLSLNTATGVVSGTPSVYGSFSFTIQASNGVSPNATQNASITINPVCLITTTTLPAGKFGIPYSQAVSTAGCASPTFAVTAGSANLATFSLSLNTSTGAISGTPGVTGLCSFTIGVTDANGNPTQTESVTIVPGPGVFGVPVGPGVPVR